MRDTRTYSEKLKDPRWQKKRLEILERDEWRCCGCGATDKTLHVHHRCYWPRTEPWEYDALFLETLCVDCHEYESGPEGGAFQKELILLTAELCSFTDPERSGLFVDLAFAFNQIREARLDHPFVVGSAITDALLDADLLRSIVSSRVAKTREFVAKLKAGQSTCVTTKDASV